MSIPTAQSFPAFEPRLFDEPGAGQYYEDGSVLGAVESYFLPDGRKGLRIDEWSSQYPSHGHTDRALKWLLQTHDFICANGIGEIDEEGVEDISVSYWRRQIEKGLVHEALLDDGTPLVGQPEPSASKRPKP